MGLINVSFLLSDPDFSEEFSVTRTINDFNDLGQQELTSMTFQAVGSLQADSGLTLTRLPELARIEGEISVYTTWALTNGNGLIDADVLINSRGQTFTVTKVKDWSNYGDGYIQATLTLLPVGNTTGERNGSA